MEQYRLGGFQAEAHLQEKTTARNYVHHTQLSARAATGDGGSEGRGQEEEVTYRGGARTAQPMVLPGDGGLEGAGQEEEVTSWKRA